MYINYCIFAFEILYLRPFVIFDLISQAIGLQLKLKFLKGVVSLI